MLFLLDSYIIQKQKDPSKAHQMKLEIIIKALKWLEIDMDLDEVHFNLPYPCIFTSPPLSRRVHSSASLIEWRVELAGGVHSCHIDTQEPRERLLCP